MRYSWLISLLAGLLVDGILTIFIHTKIIQMFAGNLQLQEKSFFGKLLSQYTCEESLSYNQFWLISVLRWTTYILLIVGGWWIIPAIITAYLSIAHFVEPENEESDD